MITIESINEQIAPLGNQLAAAEARGDRWLATSIERQWQRLEAKRRDIYRAEQSKGAA